MSEQATIAFGRAERDKGIERVTKKADKTHPGWLSLAYAYIGTYVQKRKPGDEFTAEDIVSASIAWGMIQAHDERAWSGPIRRAAAAGIIEKHPTKTGICRKRHASVCVLWRKPL